MLELASSISLTDILQVADLDVSAEQTSTSRAEAAVQNAGSLIADAASAAV